MAAWHQSRRADLGLRASGLLLCWISYAAIARLVALHVPPQSAEALAYGLAAIGFIAASGGSAMLFLGHHLFDEIEVSARWRRKPNSDPFFPLETTTVHDIVEPTMLVVGRDIDGSRTVRESAGLLLGRFASAQAAERFAQTEQRGRPAVSIATSAGSSRRLVGRLTLGSHRGRGLDAVKA